jgi:hypothetical protein
MVAFGEVCGRTRVVGTEHNREPNRTFSTRKVKARDTTERHDWKFDTLMSLFLVTLCW